jgi:hypothetical protein
VFVVVVVGGVARAGAIIRRIGMGKVRRENATTMYHNYHYYHNYHNYLNNHIN